MYILLGMCTGSFGALMFLAGAFWMFWVITNNISDHEDVPYDKACEILSKLQGCDHD